MRTGQVRKHQRRALQPASAVRRLQQSGNGRELGRSGLEEFLETRASSLAYQRLRARAAGRRSFSWWDCRHARLLGSDTPASR
jgi:hypothetical protein